ncbi:MAG: hypothetical protein ABFD92_15585 [Planctomycetaceae bacterium]|nr:hypothetical protein [Planctomycetaceae bacterium]
MAHAMRDNPAHDDRTMGQARAELILRERVKELNCLHAIARIISQKDLPMEEFLQAVVDALPKAWLYSEITCSRLRLDTLDLRTPRFQETPWSISADLMIEGRKGGSIEVFYLAQRPEQFNGPFLQEECLLLETAAKFIAFAIEDRLLRQ